MADAMHSTHSDSLWVCHQCEMIGTSAEAKAHKLATRHDIEELSPETSAGVLEEMARERARRAVAFQEFARKGGSPWI